MTIVRFNPINPDRPVTHYSQWAEDNAGEAEELRGAVRGSLWRLLPALTRLSEMGAYLPGSSAEELAEHVREVLEGDWDCGQDRDLETFEEQVE